MYINKADSVAAYDRFVQRVIERQFIWLLVERENDLPAVCGSQGSSGAYVVPVWSDKSYAIRAQSQFPNHTTVEDVPLKNFVERTIPFLIEQGELVGPNWNSNLAGLEIEPKEILGKFRHLQD